MARFRGCLRAGLGCLLLLAAAVTTPAKTIWVDASNVSGTEDGSANFPWTTIGQALAGAIQGDVVTVAPGTYSEIIDIPLGVQVVGDDPWTTIIDGGGTGPVVTIIGPSTPTATTTSLIGFTVRNGSATLGGGILIQQGQPVVSRNVVTGNTAVVNGFGGFGGGIEVYRTRAQVTNNLVFGNQAEYVGGGIDIYRSPLATVSNNTIVDNVADPMQGNDPGVGGGMALSSTGLLSLTNNLIIGNTAKTDGGGIDVYLSNPSILNHDVWNNVPNNFGGIADPTGSSGNISQDPLFTDPLLDDYTLQPGSPAIDSGTSFKAPADDFDGAFRPKDGDSSGTAEFDMGAYELRPFTDSDGDGLDDLFDNCPLVPNPLQEDGDLDGIGDICDNCVDVGNAGQQDSDSDGLGDACDNCVNVKNASQIDTDNDTFGDACDPAPTDPSIPAETVPTLGEWGVLLMAMLLGAAGLWILRRRRGLPPLEPSR